ncbi:MAG: dTDP-4-dehydrorhamnose reductase [Candidatus Rehaiarchaeum fermentans]|nr:dTDP-4-dehydrorhamnose reductase [Candidatus Rehaiarchaeum fermentans]
MRLRVLLTGAGGLLGKKILQIFSTSHEVIGVYNTSKPEGNYVIADLSKLDNVRKIISEIKPDVIIHAAALTNVDKCEEDKELAKLLNVDVTREIAKSSNQYGSLLVYISTDYVFDGVKGNYREEDEPNPINFYGLTKLQGEREVMKNSSSFIIARTSTPYGSNPASGKDNFALWLIKNLKNNEKVSVLTDQITSPTLNTSFALMLKELIESNTHYNFIIHLAGDSQISRYEFSVKLAEVFGLNKELISPTTTSEIKWKAKRPKNSSLNVEKAKNILKINKPLNLIEALKILKSEIISLNV